MSSDHSHLTSVHFKAPSLAGNGAWATSRILCLCSRPRNNTHATHAAYVYLYKHSCERCSHGLTTATVANLLCWAAHSTSLPIAQICNKMAASGEAQRQPEVLPSASPPSAASPVAKFSPLALEDLRAAQARFAAERDWDQVRSGHACPGNSAGKRSRHRLIF